MRIGLLAICLLAIGCQSSAPVAKKQPNQAAKDLTAKLKAMTPEQRTEYLKQHPDEAMAAMGMKPPVAAPK